MIRNKPIFFATGYKSSSVIKNMKAEDYWVGTAEPRPRKALRLGEKTFSCPKLTKQQQTNEVH